MTGIGEIDYEFDVIFLPKKGYALSTFAGLVDQQSTTVYQPISTSSPKYWISYSDMAIYQSGLGSLLI